jgi:hypothetical protein
VGGGAEKLRPLSNFFREEACPPYLLIFLTHKIIHGGGKFLQVGIFCYAPDKNRLIQDFSLFSASEMGFL